MLADVVPSLRCPHCRAEMRMEGRALRCAAGHSFDVARHGYASLLAGPRAPAGDSADMVAARERLLGAGRLEPLTRALVAAARRALKGGPAGPVLELGAGTAHHLAAVLDALPGRAGLAVDVSRHALRRAARAHPRVGAIAWDAWRPLPVRSGAVALALSAFAPRNGPELARVLAPGGALVLAAPTDRHLAELVGPLGLLSVDARKPERLRAQLEAHLVPERDEVVEAPIDLSHPEVAALVAMGPSARHRLPAALAPLIAALPEPVRVTLSVSVATHRRPR